MQIETEHLLGSTPTYDGQLSDQTLHSSISTGPKANKVVIPDLRPRWALYTRQVTIMKTVNDDDVTWTISISSTLTPLGKGELDRP